MEVSDVETAYFWRCLLSFKL
jgi:hypothetical protein